MSKLVKISLRIATLALLVCSLAALLACSGEAEAPSEADALAAEEAGLAAFGEKTDTAIKLKVTNDTGKELNGLEIRLAGSAEPTASIVPEDKTVATGEKVLLYFEPLEAAAETSASGENDLVLNTLYDLALSFADESSVVIHNLNLTELGELSLCLDETGNIGYVTYNDADGSEQSTVESERALVAEAEAAQKAADEAAAAQAAADAAAAAAAQDQNNYGSGSGSGDTYGGGSQDQCVDDLVFR